MNVIIEGSFHNSALFLEAKGRRIFGSRISFTTMTGKIPNKKRWKASYIFDVEED
jgi:hypothetical protein